MQIELTVTRDYDLPADALWPVVADLDAYASHSDELARTEILSGGSGCDVSVGAVRRCTTGAGDSWTERVAAWSPGRSYRLDVDTDTYPFPLRQLFPTFAGTWTVDPTTTGSRVTIEFEARVRGGWMARPVVAIMRRKATRQLEDTLDSYGRVAAAVAR